MEIVRETPWSRVREQNSVYKEFWETVGNGSSTGSSRGDNCSFRHDINKRGNMTRIRLRILSCSRMIETHREPEVPGEEAPAVECIDALARITSKELAPLHSVKSGTLQNACSTRPRVVAGLGKSAHMHIVRLIHQPGKRSKKE